MAKILVTGGAGYIGSVFVPMLLDNGHAVTVVDNFRYKQQSLMHCCNRKNFNLINGDVRDQTIMNDAIKSVDFVIPLAALVGAPICAKEPLEARQTNHDAVDWLLSRLSPDQGLIMPTTNSGYGIGSNDEYCTEESPLNPISQYGRDKVEIEEKVLNSGNSISFRLATVFGMSPRMRLDLLVNDFVFRANSDGYLVLFESHFRRNYIHIADVGRAFLHGLNNFAEMKGNAFNVGLSEANLTKLQLAQQIAKHVKDLKIIEAKVGEDPDKRDYLVSNEKIERTGFKPMFSLDDGIVELLKGYKFLVGKNHGNFV